MKNIDFKAIGSILWIFLVVGIFIVVARLLNPNGIPDEPLEQGIGFIPEIIMLLAILIILFIAIYGLRGAWQKTKEYLKLPLTGKLEKFFIGLFILFNPVWAFFSFMYCVVIGDRCGVYSTFTPYAVYLSVFALVMISYVIVLKVKPKV